MWFRQRPENSWLCASFENASTDPRIVRGEAGRQPLRIVADAKALACELAAKQLGSPYRASAARSCAVKCWREGSPTMSLGVTIRAGLDEEALPSRSPRSRILVDLVRREPTYSVAG